MNPKQFLLVGGIVLVVLGLAGMVFLGPTPDQSMLGNFFWLDGTENIAHLLFGVVALATYFLLKDEMLAKWLVVAVGGVAALVAVLGFLNASGAVPNLGLTNLENPSDNILHVVVAVWAFAAAFMSSSSTSSQG